MQQYARVLCYTARGFRFAWGERAFRHECGIGVLLVPIACYLAKTWGQVFLLLAAWLLVLIVELINTAIEKTLDRISLTFDPQIGCAKDIASAAVGATILLAVIIWMGVLW